MSYSEAIERPALPGFLEKIVEMNFRPDGRIGW
jgi:hypothetical protein